MRNATLNVSMSKHEHGLRVLYNWCIQISKSAAFSSSIKIMCFCKNKFHVANYQKYINQAEIHEKNFGPPA